MAKDRILNPEKVTMLRRNVGDFLDVDTELEHKLNLQFEEILIEAFAIFKSELVRLRKESLNYTHKKTEDIINEALAKFDEVWQTKAMKILKPELFVAIRRGILQSKDMIAVMESDKKKLNKYINEDKNGNS